MFWCKYWLILAAFIRITIAFDKITKDDAIEDLLAHIQKENTVHSILSLTSKNENCCLQMLTRMDIPFFSIKGKSKLNLKEVHNSRIIALVCLNNTNMDLLYILAEYFQGMQYNRIVLFLDDFAGNASEIHQFEIKVFKTCMQLELFNVISLYPDFGTTRRYLSYVPFPKFDLVKKVFNKTEGVFQNYLKNFMGKELLVGTSTIFPKIIFGNPTKTEPAQEMGIFGMFLRNYADIYNVTVNAPIANNRNDLVSGLRNSTIDMGIIVDILNPNIYDIPNSILVSVGHYVVILPLENLLSKNQILIETLYTKEIFIGLICNILVCALIAIVEFEYLGGIRKTLHVYLRLKSFSCMLGHSITFKKRCRHLLRFIYLLVIIHGFFNITIFSANLGLKFTTRPKQKPIKSFEDMYLRGHPKIYTNKSADRLFRYGNDKKYAQILKNTNKLDGTLLQNMFLMPEYAYNIYSGFWIYYDEVQKRNALKLFRLDPNIRYRVDLPCGFGFAFSKRSPFKNSIKISLLQAFEGGLFTIWHMHNSFKINKKINGLEPLTLTDYQNILILYAVGNILSCTVFLTEILYKKYYQRYDATYHFK